MLMPVLLLGLVLILAGCDKPIPPDANHPLLWWVGLTAGGALLAAAIWMVEGVYRRHSRRADRRDDRKD